MAKYLQINRADFSANAVKSVSVIKDMILITVTSSGGGTVSGTGNYESGDTVTISATPSNGYVFVQWNDGNTNATRTIVVGFEDTTYTATFAALQKTFIVSDPNDVGNLWTNGLSVTSRTIATQKTGYGNRFSDVSHPIAGAVVKTTAVDGMISLYKYSGDTTSGEMTLLGRANCADRVNDFLQVDFDTPVLFSATDVMLLFIDGATSGLYMTYTDSASFPKLTGFLEGLNVKGANNNYTPGVSSLEITAGIGENPNLLRLPVFPFYY